MTGAPDRPPLWERYYPTSRELSRVDCYASVESTMDVAWRSASVGRVVMAVEQVQGRGRFGRQWLTLPGASLALSARISTNASDAQRLSMAAGVGVARAVASVAGIDARLKWPNDVLIEGAKAGGILVESKVDTSGNSEAVIGIGLNVNDAPQFPNSPAATCLRHVARAPFNLVDVLDAVIAEVDAALRLEAERLLAVYRGLLTAMGRVTVSTRAGAISGEALGVSSAGALRLRDDNGAIHELLDGEVTVRGFITPTPQQQE